MSFCSHIVLQSSMDNIEDNFEDCADCSKLNDNNNDDSCENLDVSEEDISLALEYDQDQESDNAKEIHTRIEALYQKIEEKQKLLQSKREELRL